MSDNNDDSKIAFGVGIGLGALISAVLTGMYVDGCNRKNMDATLKIDTRIMQVLDNKIDAKNAEIKAYVDSGQGGFYKCDKTNTPVTTNKTFSSKQVAGDETLRQLLTVQYNAQACTVHLQ